MEKTPKFKSPFFLIGDLVKGKRGKGKFSFDLIKKGKIIGRGEGFLTIKVLVACSPEKQKFAEALGNEWLYLPEELVKFKI